MRSGPDAGAVTAVLVHGAWHGPWCWDEVRRRLDAKGIATVAPALDAVEGVHEGLHEHAAVVRSVLDEIDGPIIVVGHSYGGCVITEAAAGHDGVEHLVYLAAHMPDETETSFDLADSDPSEVPLYGGMVFSDDNTLCSVDPEVAPIAFYNDCDDEAAAVACAKLTSHSVRSLIDGLPTAVAWRTVPSTYVVCTADQAFGLAAQRRLAMRATQHVEWDTGHSPWMSRVDLVSDLVETIARSIGAPDARSGV
jgi:pimeloyl-ACP methyl ester carboxylesterase